MTGNQAIGNQATGNQAIGQPRTVTVVGASLAGLSAARALRDQGFTGQLTIVGAEPHRPYDRPPLSKEFLAGGCAEEALRLEDPAEDLDARWLLRRHAVGLDRRELAVLLDDGRAIKAHGVVIATGATARRLAGAPAGVHTLRTLDDAWALRADLLLAKRVVVVGAGFIGLEVAATVTGLGLPVTVLEATRAPLAGALGVPVGSAVADLHRTRGVELRCGVGVAGFETGPTGRVQAVVCTDGDRVPADVVVVGVGAEPAVQWLADTGLPRTGGVHCDESGATALPGVVAVGDCAAWYDPHLGRPHRVEHWTAALERPALAVAQLLGTPLGDGSRRVSRLPYFWSDQYDQRLQFAGHTAPGDQLDVEEGSLADGAGFLAVYRRRGQPVAVVALDRPRQFTRWRRALESAAAPVPVERRSAS